METKIKSNSTAINNDKGDIKQAFVNNNPVNKDNSELGKPQPQAEKPKELTTGEKAGQFKQQAEQPKTDAPKAQQVTEQAKAQTQPEAKPAKSALNLE